MAYWRLSLIGVWENGSVDRWSLAAVIYYIGKGCEWESVFYILQLSFVAWNGMAWIRTIPLSLL